MRPWRGLIVSSCKFVFLGGRSTFPNPTRTLHSPFPSSPISLPPTLCVLAKTNNHIPKLSKAGYVPIEDRGFSRPCLSLAYKLDR